MKLSAPIVLLLGLSGFVLAATPKADPHPPATTQEKQSYLERAQKEVDDWTSKIKALEERSEKRGVKTREQVDQHLKALDANLVAARKKLEELQNSGQTAWTNLRAGLDKALDDIRHHYQKAASTLDKDKKKEKS